MKPSTKAPERKARGLFSSPDIAKLLSVKPGTHSGVEITLSGVAFDLKRMTTAQSLTAFDLLSKFSGLQASLNEKNVDGQLVAEFIGVHGPEIVRLAKDVLSDAAGIATAEEANNFARFFDSLPLVETMQALLPKVMEANGFSAMQNPTLTAAE